MLFRFRSNLSEGQARDAEGLALGPSCPLGAHAQNDEKHVTVEQGGTQSFRMLFRSSRDDVPSIDVDD